MSDTHLDVPLDPDDDPDDGQAAATRDPIYVDAVSRDHERRPIVPAGLRGIGNIKASIRRIGGLLAHVTAYHAVRSPLYLLLTVLWAFVGVFRVGGRQLRWWWHADGAWALAQSAATQDDAHLFGQQHRTVLARRSFRGPLLLAELVALAVAVGLLRWLAPGWVSVLVAAIAVPMLAHFGRPTDRPIISPAVVTPRFRRLNSDIVLRAYYAAKLGDPTKPGQEIQFGSTMARDSLNTGSQVVIDLPYGRTLADAVAVKEKIASGLDVTEYQVFLSRDKSSVRRHLLFVADVDPLAIPAGRTPLLDCRARSVWGAFPFGLDERGRRVSIELLWHSMLIGAQPRKGKTFTARAIALFCALDPYVKIFVVDGKMSPDWRSFALVADQMIYGVAPNRQGDPVEALLWLLDRIIKHIEAVNETLSGLPISLCPEGKLTRELACDLRFPELRVWLLVMEEFQVYYELDDQDRNKEVAGKLSRIMAQGPSAGVILLSASQKPAGVGAGDVGRLFNRFRDNHDVRFALRCGNRLVSEAVLGGDAYSEGFDASSLPLGPEYRGVGYLYGLTDHTPTVRTYLADGQDAEKILAAARRHRQLANTLSGEAAGETAVRESRDVLRDTIRVWSYINRPGVQWQQLAELLAREIPEAYAGATAESVSALVRAEGVDSVDVKVGGRVLKGCKREHVEAAIRRRELGSR